MNILTIAKRTVQAFPGSFEGMAAALGMSINVLRNKLSRTNETHHLTVAEAMEIMAEARDAGVPDPLAMLRAMAAEFDMVLVPAGQRLPVGDLSLAERLLEQTAASHRLGTAVVEAIADGQVTPEELEQIERRRMESSQANVDLEETARTFVRAGIQPRAAA